MFATIARAIFGTANDRSLKAYQRRVPQINALEAGDGGAVRRGAAGQDRRVPRSGWPTAPRWTTCCPRPSRWCARPAKRTLGQRHFDVQLVGGMVLHDGKIAEMKTGEGKTLVATLPVYLNALAGKGVHVVTVNDYLARRDAEWMGQIYRFLGLTRRRHRARAGRRASAAPPTPADITYGTNNEFGFDYLRDNMKYRLEDMVQRDFSYAHRRRGRQHPDRRGAHAADHLRPGRGQLRPLPPGRRRGAASW